MSIHSRRTFFKKLASLTGAALLAPQLISVIARAEEGRRGNRGGGGSAPAPGAPVDVNSPMVEAGKGMAAGVNYSPKAADVKNEALKVVRNGVSFDKQNCASCMLYKSVGKKDGEDVGSCTIFQGQLVKSGGWCATWQKKV